MKEIKYGRKPQKDDESRFGKFADKYFEAGERTTYIAVAAVMACLVVVIIAWLLGRKHIDPEDFIEIKYSGIDGYASAECVVDAEKLYKNLAGKEVNMEKLTAYRKLGESFSASVEESDISNGDKLTVYVEYDEQAAKDAGVTVGKKQYNVRAKNIGSGEKIDLFSNVEVVFGGISPEAYVIVTNNWDNEYLSQLEFKPDKTSEIKTGDTVRVSCTADKSDLSRHGYAVDATEQTYIADRLSSYVSDAGDLDMEVLRELDTACRDTIAAETEDMTFRIMYRATGDESYLYMPNDEHAENVSLTGVKFLSRKNALEGSVDNYIYYLYSAEIVNGDDRHEVYFVFEFSQGYVTYDGKFRIANDDYKKIYKCSTDYEQLFQSSVGDKADMYNIFDVNI